MRILAAFTYFIATFAILAVFHSLLLPISPFWAEGVVVLGALFSIPVWIACVDKHWADREIRDMAEIYVEIERLRRAK